MEENQRFGFMINECYRKTYSFDQTWTLQFLGIWTEISLAEEGKKIYSVLMLDKLVDP
jgi:hypothetical protein